MSLPDETAVRTQLTQLRTALEAVRDAHETTADGQYKRCSCELCATERRLSAEKVVPAADYELLFSELEETAQAFRENEATGSVIRHRLVRALGFFFKNSDELSEVVQRAVESALKDPAFKSFYDERKTASRDSIITSLRQAQQLETEVHSLSQRVSEIENVTRALRTEVKTRTQTVEEIPSLTSQVK